MSVGECAIQFWRKDSPAGKVLGRVDYIIVRDGASASPEFTNVVGNVPLIFDYEVLYRTNMSENGRRRLQRPEQKSVALLKDLVQKLSTPGDLVVVGFSETLSTAKACLMPENHKIFVEYEKDSDCVKSFMAGLVEFYFCELQNDKYDLRGQEMKEAELVYLRDVKRRRSR